MFSAAVQRIFGFSERGTQVCPNSLQKRFMAGSLVRWQSGHYLSMDEAREQPTKRRRTRRRAPPGSSPGTILVDPAAPKPVLSAVLYSKDGVREETPGDLAALRKSAGGGTVLWLDVAGLGDEA